MDWGFITHWHFDSKQTGTRVATICECGLRADQVKLMQQKKILKMALDKEGDYQWCESSAQTIRDQLFDSFDADLIDFIILLHGETYRPAPTLVFANSKPGDWAYLQETASAQLKLETASPLPRFHFLSLRPAAVVTTSITETAVPDLTIDDSWGFI